MIQTRLRRLEERARRISKERREADEVPTHPNMIRRAQEAGIAFEQWPWVLRVYAENQMVKVDGQWVPREQAQR
jgi:hypothetical protein